MADTPLPFRTAVDLARHLETGDCSAEELTRALLDRIDAVDDTVHSYLHVDHEGALAAARSSDQRRKSGETRGPLDGIPVALKDVLCLKDAPLTCASRILEHYVSPYTGTAVAKCQAAGTVFLGKLNLDEFAMGSSTENSAFQTTVNPWDPERIPGGSSGGSAASVAAGEAILTLGSDTGGSIRQPAALCGVVGMKPTYGLVSRYGLAAFASSLDQIGPFSRTVEDTALMLQAIAGHDPKDSTSVKTDIPDYRAALDAETGPWKLGVPREFFGEGLDDAVREAVDRAIDFYRQAGHEIVEVSLPHTGLSIPVYYIIATAECSSNLARYDGIRYTSRAERFEDGIDLYARTRGQFFGEEVKRRVILGTYVLSSGYYDAYYLRAQKVRTLMREDFTRVYDQGVHALITPTSPTVAFRKGERTDDPLKMYLSDIFTISANLAGMPGISVPGGFDPDGLPIGLQLIGRPFDEKTLLAIAHQYDREHAFGRRYPEIKT
ncbi:MAG: Asp-tRNA(Asn)/Glu-tRNA(Gln) amidotransferase subunit GatA [Opitutales bacterium]